MSTVKQYRKKPVVINAVLASELIADARGNWKGLPDFIVAAYDKGDVIFCSDHIEIRTLEGMHRAEKTDMVIQGIASELYPCKIQIFSATYEPVEPLDNATRDRILGEGTTHGWTPQDHELLGRDLPVVEK